MIPYEPVCFLMRDRKQADRHRRGALKELGSVEDITRIYGGNLLSRQENLIERNILYHFLLSTLSHLG